MGRPKGSVNKKLKGSNFKAKEKPNKKLEALLMTQAEEKNEKKSTLPPDKFYCPGDKF